VRLSKAFGLPSFGLPSFGLSMDWFEGVVFWVGGVGNVFSVGGVGVMILVKMEAPRRSWRLRRRDVGRALLSRNSRSLVSISGLSAPPDLIGADERLE
jgi:hypothetical protein